MMPPVRSTMRSWCRKRARERCWRRCGKWWTSRESFVRTRRKDLDWVFALQYERTVNQDNTIALDNRTLQIEKSRWRNTLAGCTVTVYEFLNGAIAVRFGPHEVARFAPEQLPQPQPK